MGECNPYLYFHHTTSKLMICFYTQESDGSGQIITKKQPREYEISEADAMAKYSSLYIAALENLKKREGQKPLPIQEKQDISIKAQQPAKEGVEKVVLS